MNTTNRSHLSRFFVVLPLALTLSACVLGTKVGDLPGESTGETPDTDGASSGAGATGNTGTSGEPASTSNGGTSGAVSTSNGDTGSTGGEPGMCEGLDEAGCAATPTCRAVHGSAFDFEGCATGPQFLGCISDLMPCDLALTTVCREGTDEVYLNTDGCMPDGFAPCQTELALCGSCEALSEEECLAEPQECQGLYGAPHVEQQGAECVDFKQQVFLACAANGGACPPFVPTVCPKGETAPQFDVPSGCIPFGFETCEGGAPACP
jgi:hypothetical protein